MYRYITISIISISYDPYDIIIYIYHYCYIVSMTPMISPFLPSSMAGRLVGLRFGAPDAGRHQPPLEFHSPSGGKDSDEDGTNNHMLRCVLV